MKIENIKKLYNITEWRQVLSRQMVLNIIIIEKTCY